MTLPPGSLFGDGFELSLRIGGDEEGEDYTAKRPGTWHVVHVRVLVPDEQLLAASGSVQRHLETVAKLDLVGIPRALAAGVHEPSGRVWFMQEWTHGKPLYGPDEWDWERCHAALCAAAALLDPARALGVRHGRLEASVLLRNFGADAVRGLLAGSWLGEVRPLGPGGDLGQLGRAILRACGTIEPSKDFLAWVDRCEQEPAQFSSLGEALDGMPVLGLRRAEIEHARAEERAALQRESARQWRERLDEQLRTGEAPPEDLPYTLEQQHFASVLARVQQFLGEVPLEVQNGSVQGLGLWWQLPSSLHRDSGWRLARALVRALRVLARDLPSLGTMANPDYKLRQSLDDVRPSCSTHVIEQLVANGLEPLDPDRYRADVIERATVFIDRLRMNADARHHRLQSALDAALLHVADLVERHRFELCQFALEIFQIGVLLIEVQLDLDTRQVSISERWYPFCRTRRWNTWLGGVNDAETLLLSEAAKRLSLSYDIRDSLWTLERAHPIGLDFEFGNPARVVAENGELTVGQVIEGWVSSHERGNVFALRGTLPLSRMPQDPEAAAELLAALLDAANLGHDRNW